MDRASQVLAQGVPPGVPRSYRAPVDHGNERKRIREPALVGRSVDQAFFFVQLPAKRDSEVEFFVEVQSLAKLASLLLSENMRTGPAGLGLAVTGSRRQACPDPRPPHVARVLRWLVR